MIKCTAMYSDKNEIRDVDSVVLQECTDSESHDESKSCKRPKRVLQFSDGVLEEYSSEDEMNAPSENKIIAHTDPKTLTWVPWVWYQTIWVSGKMLDGCDYMGECLASFFGITAPKYQFEINEFYRLQALENEAMHNDDIEINSWNKQHRNNLLGNDSKV